MTRDPNPLHTNDIGGPLTTITAPCVVPDMDEATYHGDPVEGGSLSSTGARAILRSPAHYDWERQNRVHKKVFDEGTAVHSLVLGTGWPIAVLEYDSWRTKAAQDAQTAARLDGKVPLLRKDYERVRAVADAVLAHPSARALLERDGVREASAFAPDPQTGVWLRARPDFLPDRIAARTVGVDLKTARDASVRAFAKASADYGYAIQAEHYKRTIQAARGDDKVGFVFVVVENDPPHPVSVIELTGDYPAIARVKLDRAIRTYAECTAAGSWPGYPEDIQYAEPPVWYVRQSEEDQ